MTEKFTSCATGSSGSRRTWARHPVASNATDESRAKTRRVELMKQ
jgi:hypothetical protein